MIVTTAAGDRLGAALGAEFGPAYSDRRAEMADRPGFDVRPLAGIDTIAVHHTAGLPSVPWTTIRDQHQAKPWPGIGYHVGIQHGHVAYLGDAALRRACVGMQNHRVICVVIAGRYDAADAVLAPEDYDALRRIVRVLDAWLGRTVRVLGHGQIEGQSTACPGRAVLDVLPGIRTTSPARRPAVGEAHFALLRQIRDGLAGREVIALNPAAGLQRTIRASGWVPTTAEWSELDDGVEYVCQGAATVENARVRRRVYYVRKPAWDAIRFVDVT